MKKEFPEKDFISLRRIEFKNLITRHYLGQYKNQTKTPWFGLTL